jgi:hypothetical protein
LSECSRAAAISAACCPTVLLRLAYLGLTNAFAMLRLLPMSDRDKDAEILALRHQITVLERQLGKERVRTRLVRRCRPRRRCGGSWTPSALRRRQSRGPSTHRRACIEAL